MRSGDKGSDYLLGIDIGGTKLAVGVVTRDGRVVAQERIPTQANQGPDMVIARVQELCRTVVRKAGITWEQVLACGVGCGGPLDIKRGRVMNPPNLPGWLDVPLVQTLEEAFGRPVYLDNDANAAALGEHRFGAGRGVRNMVYLTISTGIGGGLIFGGRLYSGENGNAGEIGHMSLNVNGRPCNCGGRGCLEAYASGTSIAARAREAVEAGESSLLTDLAGSPDAISGETVKEALLRGDALARRIWDETMEILGAGLANVINIFNPQRIVLGGGITNYGDLLFVPVRRIALARAMRPLASAVEIVPAELGNDVGILGAAAVVLERLEARTEVETHV
ncbi:glucokinase [Symbiobacterium terraclitae]|uniref:Glucokinase n=1 Tax=Symbiobacterium terraclitae TaxID=557451 RepID=A0ABS4JSA8_9FIRM|nr:ROK family protein [Symbiobacterium terraclitae]MBP2018400.1 glucokinase [Symbiobacterium terraclitae]